MRRRIFLKSLLSGVGVATFPSSSFAYSYCWADQNYGLELCRAGIQSKQFLHVRSYQKTLVWCWAAVYEMIFAWHGVRISQENIVKQTYGAAIPTALDPISLVRNAHTSYIDNSGDQFSVNSRIFSADFGILQLDNGDIVDELENENPLIICNSSHMMVLIGVEYIQEYSLPTIIAGWVADPFPLTNYAQDMGPGFRDLYPVELVPAPNGQMRFLSTVHVS